MYSHDASSLDVWMLVANREKYMLKCLTKFNLGNGKSSISQNKKMSTKFYWKLQKMKKIGPRSATVRRSNAPIQFVRLGKKLLTVIATHLNTRMLLSCSFYRYLQNSDCEDEQFIFEDRGDINVKGMKTPVTCYLLSRNLKKLPKVQLLLESNLAIGSRSPLLPNPGGLSPSGKWFCITKVNS